MPVAQHCAGPGRGLPPIVLLATEPWLYGGPIVCWAGCQVLAPRRTVPRLHFPGIQGVRIKPSSYSLPNYFQLHFSGSPMVLFFQELRSNESIKKFKHYAWTVYQENNHTQRSCKFAQWKFLCGEVGKGIAMGRVRFLPEMLTNWTGAGVKLPWSTHSHTHTAGDGMSAAVFVGLF